MVAQQSPIMGNRGLDFRDRSLKSSGATSFERNAQKSREFSVKKS